MVVYKGVMLYNGDRYIQRWTEKYNDWEHVNYDTKFSKAKFDHVFDIAKISGVVDDFGYFNFKMNRGKFLEFV